MPVASSILIFRRHLLVLLSVAALLFTVLPGAARAAHVETNDSGGLVTAVRWSGETRFETASLLAVEGTAATIAVPATSAILTTGRNFPDALAGSYLSGVVGGPILLTEQDSIPAATLSRLTGNADSDLGEVTTIYLLGGPVAISAGVEASLEGRGYTVIRLAGADRIATAAEIATESPGGTVGSVNGLRTAILATAQKFPDALVAGAASRAASLPLLLTNTDVLPQDTIDALDALDIEQVVIAGGPIAISAAVESAVSDLGYQTRRLAGEDRDATAVEFAKFNVADLGFTTNEIGLARNNNFPDALAFAPFAGREGLSIVLTAPTALPTVTADYLAEIASCQFDTLYIPGGPDAVSDGVEQAARESLTASNCGGVDNEAPSLVTATLVTDADSNRRVLPSDGDDYVIAEYDEAVVCEDSAPEQFTYTDSSGDVTAATSIECDDADVDDEVILGFPAGTIDPDDADGTITYIRSGNPDDRIYDNFDNEAVSPDTTEIDQVVAEPGPTEPPASPPDAAFTVNTGDDAVDANPGDGVCETAVEDQCSLRAAVQEANANDGADTINVPADTYALTITGEDDADDVDPAATGDLDITEDVTIVGAGEDTVIIDASALTDRIFDVVRATATISGVTITGGDVPGALRGGGIRVAGDGAALDLSASTVSGNNAGQAGGGIENTGGTVDISDVTFDANTTGGAAEGEVGNGGAIHAAGGTTSVTGGSATNNLAVEGGAFWTNNPAVGAFVVDTVSFTGNTASGGAGTMAGDRQGGGALYADGGDFDIDDSSFAGNTATEDGGSGGAILIAGGTATVDNSTFDGNLADRAGGAIEIDLGDVTVNGSDFDSNVAEGVVAPGNGGAIHNGGGTVTVNGGSATNNDAVEGGAFWTRGANVFTVTGNTVTGNTADEGGAFYSSGGIFDFIDVDATNGGHEVDAAGVSKNEPDVVGNVYVEVSFMALDPSATATGSTFTDIDYTNGGDGTDEPTCSNLVDGGDPAVTMNTDDDGTCFRDLTLGDFVVNVTTDAVDAAIGDGICETAVEGECSLRAAVQEANSDPAEDTIVFETNGPIVLTTTGAGEDAAATGDLDVTNPIVIDGGGPIVISAIDLGDRAFDIIATTASIRGLTIDGGTAPAATDRGGALRLDAASTVTIAASTLSNNSAPQAGGAVENTGGTLTVTDTDFSDNSSTGTPGNGGAIHAAGGTTSVTGGSATNNLAVEGGAFWTNNPAVGAFVVDTVSFTGNTASGGAGTMAGDRQGGGALYADGGDFDIDDSSFAGNTATEDGGSGGAILIAGGTATVDNSTFDGNLADRAGGAIEIDLGDVTVNGSDFDSNVAEGVVAPGNGGAIHNGGGTASVTGGSATNNSAVEGGAFWTSGANTFTVAGTLATPIVISGNEATGGDAGTPGARQGGGALYADGGTFDIDFADFDGNIATTGSGSGGAILIAQPGGSATVDNSTFDDNDANRAGGAIEVDLGSVTVTDSDFTSNDVAFGAAPGNGGAIHNGGGTASVTGGTTSGNSAVEGGAFWTSGANIFTVDTVIFDANTASGGAADGAGAFAGGGALYADGGTFDIDDATFTNNTAIEDGGSGGAILIATAAGSATVDNSTFDGNLADRAGGAIEVDLGDVMVNGSDFDSNVAEGVVAPGNGGAIHNGGGTVTVNGGSVTNNDAVDGGAFWTRGANAFTVNGTTVTGNTADEGGAFYSSGGVFDFIDVDATNGGHEVDAAGVSKNEPDVVGNVYVEESFMALVPSATATGSTFTDVIYTDGIGGTDEPTCSNVVDPDASGPPTGNTDDDGTCFGAGPGAAFVVNVSTDAVDADLTDGICETATAGECSLRAAIMQANADVASQDITFTVATVNLNTTGADNADAASGDLDITEDVMISGAVTVDGAALGDRILDVIGASVDLSGLTLQNGAVSVGTFPRGGAVRGDATSVVTITDATLVSNSATQAGGAVENTGGQFTITNTDFTTNDGGDATGNGGALHAAGGTTNVTGGTVDGNSADEGGGFWIGGGGTLTVDGTTFTNNVADGAGDGDGGGALYNDGGTLDVDNATIGTAGNGNTANTGLAISGGGILSDGGTLTVDDSSFTDNAADRAGGAIEIGATAPATTPTITNTDFTANQATAATSAGNGGAIHTTNQPITISGGTADGNTAAEGGAFWNGSGTMNVTGTTFTNNVANGANAGNGGGALYNNGGIMNVTDAEVGTTGNGNDATGAGGATGNASGGGLLSNGGTVTITGTTTFTENTAVRAGGAIEATGTTQLTSTGVVFTSNTAGAAPGNGGAVHQTGAGTLSTFTGGSAVTNSAGLEGGAFWIGGGGSMTLDTVTLTDNAATNAGGALYNDSTTTSTLVLDMVIATADAGGSPTGNIYADEGATPGTDADTNGGNNFTSAVAGATCSAVIGTEPLNTDDDDTCFPPPI